jgi:hypothetical protein
MSFPDAVAAMEAYLRQCASVWPAGTGGAVAGRLVVAPDLSGPPGVAHGGGTTALFFELARSRLEAAGRDVADCLPVEIGVALPQELTVATPHDLAGAFEVRGDGAWTFGLAARRDGLLIAEARVAPAGGSGRAGDLAGERPPAADRAFAVPGSESCLVCGSRNARGLSLRLAYDAARVGKALAAPPAFRDGSGRLSPAYGFLVLDEVGWWLGALHTGECGVTNRLRVVVWDTAGPGEAVSVVGPRDGLTPLDRKGRQWEGRVTLCGGDGRVLMSGEVAFAGSRAYSKMMLPGLLAASEAADVFRAFPRYGPGEGTAKAPSR